MYDEALIEVAAEADVQLRANLAAQAPYMAEVVDAWIDELFDGAGLAEVFTRSDAFPMLLIPWWIDGSIGSRDHWLHRMLTYSTMSGYLYIRMIDNLMDGDAAADVHLLPALSFLQLEFVDPYRRLFPAAHPFWSDFREIWVETADLTMQDAALQDVTQSAFVEISSRKTGAAKIPVAAVCHFRRRTHLQPRWDGFVDAFGRWHQMHSDIFSWRQDVAHETATFFLSEGRRSRPDGGLAGWLIEEGFSWGVDELERFMVELRRIGIALDSDDALRYLEDRESEVTERAAEIKSDLATLLGLSNALQR